MSPSPLRILPHLGLLLLLSACNCCHHALSTRRSGDRADGSGYQAVCPAALGSTAQVFETKTNGPPEVRGTTAQDVKTTSLKE